MHILSIFSDTYKLSISSSLLYFSMQQSRLIGVSAVCKQAKWAEQLHQKITFEASVSIQKIYNFLAWGGGEEKKMLLLCSWSQTEGRSARFNSPDFEAVEVCHRIPRLCPCLADQNAPLWMSRSQCQTTRQSTQRRHLRSSLFQFLQYFCWDQRTYS